MEKVTLYGLGGAGKSCYIYAMAQALSQGIKFSDRRILTVRCAFPQINKLNEAYKKMRNGEWPVGTGERVEYNFNCRLATEKIMEFSIEDYRGGLLNTCDKDDEEEQEKLIKSFAGSSVLLFFIGADTIKQALNGDFEQQANLNVMGTLHDDYLKRTNDSRTPIMIVISKSDMLSESEKIEAKKLVLTAFQYMFGAETNLTAAITMVTLGKGLKNNGGEMEGTLIIGPTAGNLHIPILYSLFSVISNRIESSIGRLTSAQQSYTSAQSALSHELSRSSIARFFSNNESSIRQRITQCNSAIDSEKELLNELSKILSEIKPLILNGADVYINGVKQ